MIGDVMKEEEMRVIQLFLHRDEPIMYEVKSNQGNTVIVCDCPDFAHRNKCKHAKYVHDKAAKNGGAYPMLLDTDVTSEDLSSAVKSPEAFRDFILKYGKIEVI